MCTHSTFKWASRGKIRQNVNDAITQLSQHLSAAPRKGKRCRHRPVAPLQCFDLGSHPCLGGCGCIRSRKETAQARNGCCLLSATCLKCLQEHSFFSKPWGMCSLSLLARSLWCTWLTGIWKVTSHQSCPSCIPQDFCPLKAHGHVSSLKNVTEPLTYLREEVSSLWSHDDVASSLPQNWFLWDASVRN